MSDYIKTTDFAIKDTLTTGDPSKRVKGAEIDAEFEALEIAIASKLNASAFFPTGTRMLFQQTAAPTGWTKVVSYDNYALRLTSGTISSGGTVDFTSAFTAVTSGGTAITTAQMPSHSHGGLTGNENATHYHNVSGSTGTESAQHTHDYTFPAYTGVGAGEGSWNYYAQGTAQSSVESTTHYHSFNVNSGTENAYHQHSITAEGGGQAHTHTVNMAVKYIDVILAQKD